MGGPFSRQTDDRGAGRREGGLGGQGFAIGVFGLAQPPETFQGQCPIEQGRRARSAPASRDVIFGEGFLVAVEVEQREPQGFVGVRKVLELQGALKGRKRFLVGPLLGEDHAEVVVRQSQGRIATRRPSERLNRLGPVSAPGEIDGALGEDLRILGRSRRAGAEGECEKAHQTERSVVHAGRTPAAYKRLPDGTNPFRESLSLAGRGIIRTAGRANFSTESKVRSGGTMRRTTRRIMTISLLGSLALWQIPVRAQAPTADADLSTGIRQVREGDFDAALITLDGVAKRLAAEKGREKDLARAYTYLAIAYVGLAQQEKAKAEFKEAWRADKSMTLSPKEFPPSIVEFFEQARKEGEAEARAQAAARAAANPAPPKGAAPPAGGQPAVAKKHGSNKALLFIGLGGAAAAGVALAAGGGGGSSGPTPQASPNPVPTPTPSSASVTFVSSTPPPGGTITAPGNSDPNQGVRLDMTFSMLFPSNPPRSVTVRLFRGNFSCVSASTSLSLVAGQQQTVTVSSFSINAGSSNCLAPMTTDRVGLIFDGSNSPNDQNFSVSYNFVH